MLLRSARYESPRFRSFPDLARPRPSNQPRDGQVPSNPRETGATKLKGEIGVG